MEAFVRDIAVLDRGEAVAAEPPVEQPPLADQDEAAIVAQRSRDLAGMNPATCLDDQVEEIVGIGKAPRAAVLEGNSTLGIKAHPRDGVSNRLCRWIDTAHPGRRKLAREKQRSLTVAASDLEDSLGPIGQAQHSRGEGGE